MQAARQKDWDRRRHEIRRGIFHGRRVARDAEKTPMPISMASRLEPPALMNGSARPLFGRQAGDDTDVDDGLVANQRGDAHGEQASEPVARMQRDVNAAQGDQKKSGDDQQRGDQSEFLADVGENKIAVNFRQKTEFLPAIAQAQAGPTAGTHGDFGLFRLQRRAAGVGFGMQPRINASTAHRVMF